MLGFCKAHQTFLNGGELTWLGTSWSFSGKSCPVGVPVNGEYFCEPDWTSRLPEETDVQEAPESNVIITEEMANRTIYDPPVDIQRVEDDETDSH